MNKNQNETENDCSSWESCLGYEINLKYNYSYLYISTSPYTADDDHCPHDYEFIRRDRTPPGVALNGRRQEDAPSEYRCYGKTQSIVATEKPMAKM